MAKTKQGGTRACASKVLFAIMQEMKRNGGSIRANDIDPFVEANVELTDWEKERAGKMQWVRWRSSKQFYSIDYGKAGFIVKKNGTWYLTPEGEEVMKLGADEVMNRAEAAYRKWRQSQEGVDPGPEEPDVEKIENQPGLDLEMLESNARDGIKKFLAAKGAYEFQDLVAALLRAMGYHTPFIAPKGKDGGIDIIAYVDPLGAQTPRIKVQVKHKPDTAIGASEVRALLGVMQEGDIALFVTSGTFSTDAKNTATTSPKFVRLIDGDEFIEMWQEYYDKMSDDDKNMLPLKRIAFLGSNE